MELPGGCLRFGKGRHLVVVSDGKAGERGERDWPFGMRLGRLLAVDLGNGRPAQKRTAPLNDETGQGPERPSATRYTNLIGLGRSS